MPPLHHRIMPYWFLRIYVVFVLAVHVVIEILRSLIFEFSLCKYCRALWPSRTVYLSFNSLFSLYAHIMVAVHARIICYLIIVTNTITVLEWATSTLTHYTSPGEV